MNVILSFMLALIAVASHVRQSPALMDPQKESVSIKDLRNAPTMVVLDNKSLYLSAYPWRDFMPKTGPPAPDGSPLMVGLKVASADKKPIPSGLLMDRAWVLFGDELWEASDIRGRIPAQPHPIDSWINCSDLPVCETTVREGPKWGPGVFVDVVVRLTDSEGKHYFLQAPKQYIRRTD
jgi:hypothetical protein